MELVKKTENLTRTYKDGSLDESRVNDIQYVIKNNGTPIGSASISAYAVNISMNITGDISQLEEMVRNLLSTINLEGGAK